MLYFDVCADGDIYGSEGQYHRYEEGDWDDDMDMDEHYQDVSSGQVQLRGRSGCSFGADRYSGDNMGGHDDDAYVTPETTASLQAADFFLVLLGLYSHSYLWCEMSIIPITNFLFRATAVHHTQSLTPCLKFCKINCLSA